MLEPDLEGGSARRLVSRLLGRAILRLSGPVSAWIEGPEPRESLRLRTPASPPSGG